VEDAEIKLYDDYFHELHNEPDNKKWDEINFVADWVLSKKGE